MISQIKLRKNNNNKSAKKKTSVNLAEHKEIKSAIEDAKKYYEKYYAIPNSLFISQLQTKKINIILSNYNYNDISVIYGILKKYQYFESISLSPEDPDSKIKNTRKKNEREPITEGEQYKIDKEKRDKEIEKLNMLIRILSGIGKHLSITNKLKSLLLNNLNLDKKIANLAKGIIGNNSLEKLKINNCIISLGEYNQLLKGLYEHIKIQYLDLSNNNFEDRYGNIIGRIIARQTFKRDQTIWLKGIRNEKPLKEELDIGLISIDLSGNRLSKYSAECISTSLSLDQYIRYINLSNNEFDKDSCKKFIYMLRKNMTLLNVDLRNNPGYDDNIKFRLVIKMSKNIRHLYNQFKKNIYTPEEYEKLKKFIDPTFFNSEIPEDIIKQFNAQNEEMIKNFTFSNNTNSNTNNNTNNKYNLKQILVTENINKKNNDNKNKTEKKNIEVNNINANENKRPQSSDKSYKRESNLDKLSEKNNNKNKYNNIFLGNNGYSKYNKHISLSIDNKKRNNHQKNNGNNNVEKLLHENLMLKKKIIEFKAKEIQNKLGKNIFIPEKYDNNSLNNNFNIADELLDKLNNVMYSMKKNGKNNNFKNINAIKEEKNDEKNDDNLNDKLGKFNNIDYIDIN